MSRATTTMTVHLNGVLSNFVSANVGEDGDYENVSEYRRVTLRSTWQVQPTVASMGHSPLCEYRPDNTGVTGSVHSGGHPDARAN